LLLAETKKEKLFVLLKDIFIRVMASVQKSSSIEFQAKWRQRAFSTLYGMEGKSSC